MIKNVIFIYYFIFVSFNKKMSLLHALSTIEESRRRMTSNPPNSKCAWKKTGIQMKLRRSCIAYTEKRQIVTCRCVKIYTGEICKA